MTKLTGNAKAKYLNMNVKHSLKIIRQAVEVYLLQNWLTDLKNKQKIPHLDKVGRKDPGRGCRHHLKLDLNKNQKDSITRTYCLEASAQQRIQEKNHKHSPDKK